MKTKISLILLAAAIPAYSVTVFRVDPIPVMTTAGTAPAGGFPALYAVAGAKITLCADSVCANFATSYLDSAGITTCPQASPVTLPGVTPAQCTAFAGPQGQFGFWLAQGLYYYKITLSTGSTYGPYALSVAAGAGGAIPTPSPADALKYAQINAAGNGYQATASTTVSATDYNFIQTPGGALTAGLNVVTMTPCPLGIVTSGTMASAIYISGGVGTAEWARLAGGSCTPGAATGNIIFTTANTHSGAWTITSATQGIDLACSSNATGAYVVVPPGNYNIYGSIRPSVGCTVDGLGSPAASGPSGAVNLHMQTNGIPMFDLLGPGTAVTIRNLQLSFGAYPAYTVGGLAAASGSVGIGSGINGAIDQPVLENLIINNFYNGVIAQHGSISINHVSVLASVQDGFVLGGAGALGLASGFMESTLSQASGGNGYTLNAQSALQWHSTACFANGGWGMQINAGANVQMDNVDCEADRLGEMYLNGGGGIFQNMIFEAAGQGPWYSTNTTAPGLKIANVNMLGTVISNVFISGSQGNGMELDGNYVVASNFFLDVNGNGSVAGHRGCMTDAGVTQTLSNIFCYQQVSTITGGGNSITNSQFVGPPEYNGTPDTAPLIEFGTLAQDMTFTGNVVFNPALTAIQYDSGASGMEGWNNVTGTVTGVLGYHARSIANQPLVPIPNATALTVTSNTIAPTLPLHTLGAGLIKTMTPLNAGISMCLDIIATAAFSTDQTANIATPAITATVGKLYRACFNAGNGYWYLTN